MGVAGTAERTQTKATPELEAVMEVIRHIDEHKQAPPTTGNAGRHKHDVQNLIETLQEAGIEAYQQERIRFLEKNPIAYALLATDNGTSEPEQKKKTLINLLELRKRPRPAWVIEDFFYEGTIIELYAEAGSYKSFLSLDWSARIATGTDWMGHRVTKQGPVVYIAAEGASGYISRIDAWCHHNDIPFNTLAKNFWFWDEPLPLTNSSEIARFIEEVTEALRESGQSPQFVVIDTLLRCSGGQNINAPDIMGALFMGAETIKRELHTPNVLIVHHAGKNAQLGGMGSVVLKNNCDIIYFMKKDSAVEGQVILQGEKVKDKAEPTIYLRTEKVYYGELPIEDESSLVLVAGERPGKEQKQEKKMPKSQKDLLAILDKHGSLRYAEWLKLYENEGGKKTTFTDALKALTKNTAIEEHKEKYRRYVESSQERDDEEEYEGNA